MSVWRNLVYRLAADGELFEVRESTLYGEDNEHLHFDGKETRYISRKEMLDILHEKCLGTDSQCIIEFTQWLGERKD